MFMAIDTALMEREVQRLQEKNRQIKLLAKQVMSASQNVSAELRSGDIEKIRAVLNEYEQQLEQTQNTVISTAPVVNIFTSIPLLIIEAWAGLNCI